VCDRESGGVRTRRARQKACPISAATGAAVTTTPRTTSSRRRRSSASRPPPVTFIDTPDRLIPYQPWALARRNELRGQGANDPQAHCAPSGAPRKNVTLFGWKFVQPEGYVLLLYESMHDYRIIPTNNRPHIPARIRLWHGDPVGRWEGDTLVVSYRNLNGRHWFDMSGNFQSENLHVVERYTMYDPDAILFEARIEDDTMYTRPWTLALAFERNTEEGYYQLEYACHEGERDLQHLLDAAN
jgi:hypothetical protein